jgi:hypothetical protein
MTRQRTKQCEIMRGLPGKYALQEWLKPYIGQGVSNRAKSSISRHFLMVNQGLWPCVQVEDGYRIVTVGKPCDKGKVV